MAMVIGILPMTIAYVLPRFNDFVVRLRNVLD